MNMKRPIHSNRHQMSLSLVMSVMTMIIIASSCIYLANSVAVGIDFSSSAYKAVLVQNKFRLVLNEQSGRKTSTAIAFRQGNRYFSSLAENAARFQPETCFSYVRDFIGKTSLLDPSIEHTLKNIFYANRLQETSAKALNGSDVDYSYLSVRYDNDDHFLSVPELVAMILEQCSKMVDKEAETHVPDAVITVPAYWTQRERVAFTEAAELAGFNVLSLLNELTAFALQYAVDFLGTQFDAPRLVMIVSAGESGLELAIYKFEIVLSSAKGKKQQNVTQLTTVGAAWDTHLGGRELERRIADYVAAKLKAEKGVDISNNKRAYLRLLGAAKKAKEVLSANKETFISVEQIQDDVDVREPITRELFEELNADLFARITERIDSLLVQHNISRNDLHAIEMVGGASRVPRLQEEIRKYFGRQTLDFHLNGDEGAVFGAAYLAAALSPQHRVKEVRVRDTHPWSVAAHLTELPGADAAEPLNREATLFRSGNRCASKKTLSFHAERDFELSLDYNTTVPQAVEGDDGEVKAPPPFTPLPEGTPTHIEKMVFTGVPTKAEYPTMIDTPKIHLQFRLTHGGVIELVDSKAEFRVVEQVKRLKQPAPATPPPEEAKGEGETSDDDTVPKDDNAQDTTANASEAAEPTAENEQQQQPQQEEAKEGEPQQVVGEAPAKPEYVYEDQIITRTVNLRVSRAQRSFLPVSQRTVFAKTLSEFREIDRIRIETEESRNAVEAFIYKYRDLLTSDDWISVTTEEEREKIVALLDETRDWLEDEGDNSNLQQFREKLSALETSVASPQFRLSERSEVPSAFQACKDSMNMTLSYLVNITERLQVNQSEVEEVSAISNELSGWLSEKEQLFAESLPYEDPKVTSTQVQEKCVVLFKKTRELLKRPRRPLPKPVPTTSEIPSSESDSESAEPVPEPAEQNPDSVPAQTADEPVVDSNENSQGREELK